MVNASYLWHRGIGGVEMPTNPTRTVHLSPQRLPFTWQVPGVVPPSMKGYLSQRFFVHSKPPRTRDVPGPLQSEIDSPVDHRYYRGAARVITDSIIDTVGSCWDEQVSARSQIQSAIVCLGKIYEGKRVLLESQALTLDADT